MGISNLCSMASAIPPRAEPSSLVKIIPVTSTASVKTAACANPFWPVVASTTNKTSEICALFSITRRTFPSSAIKSALLCKRPAVSIIRLSAPASVNFLAASNATAAGSLLAAPLITSLPIFSPQVFN